MSVQSSTLSPSQQAMVELWERHISYEFATHDVPEIMATMTAQPVNLNVPTLTGGIGGQAVHDYYRDHFVPKNPPDTEIQLVSRTVGTDRIVDEMVMRFTHTLEMDWMLPGIPPTGRRVELPILAIVQFEGGLIAGEHIYWDQACVLVQLGLLAADGLPVAGADCARTLLAPASGRPRP
jgi:carboxymethylenebutenolidase